MISASSKTKKLLALSQLKGVGERTLSSLSNFGYYESASIDEITNKVLNKNFSREEIVIAEDYASFQIETANKMNHKIISIFDNEYPLSLRSATVSPPILFCYGNIQALHGNCLTIIGTREPTTHGEIIGEKLTTWFTLNGWNIVSGLALGIDTIAHKSCISAGGRTIAVMAHGLEKIYPKQNTLLVENIIAKGGLIVSEYGYNSTTSRANFVKRDSTQAALSSGVLLVQTGFPGGSLHASKACLTMNRPLIVAGQSKTDIINSEAKIQGNLLLSSMDKSTIMKTLKINSFDIRNLMILSSKEDYNKVNDELKGYLFSSNNTGTIGMGF